MNNDTDQVFYEPAAFIAWLVLVGIITIVRHNRDCQRTHNDSHHDSYASPPPAPV